MLAKRKLSRLDVFTARRLDIKAGRLSASNSTTWVSIMLSDQMCTLLDIPDSVLLPQVVVVVKVYPVTAQHRGPLGSVDAGCYFFGP